MLKNIVLYRSRQQFIHYTRAGHIASAIVNIVIIVRKLYPNFQMVPHSMTLSDLSPTFQGHDNIQRPITRKRYKIEL